MGRCKDCKWWLFDEELQVPHGRCELVDVDGGDKVFPEVLAWPDGDSGDGFYRLRTMPDFGCVQFEAKPA